jgi:hypothetical protein
MTEATAIEGSAPAGGTAVAPLRIFISYRNQDVAAQGKTWPLYGELVGRFGEENVFFDKGTLKPGDSWFAEIKQHASGCGAFLALIGPAWLDCLEEHLKAGGKDFVAAELDLAFQAGSKVTVIPMLIDGAELPSEVSLPPSLKRLRQCHTATMRFESQPSDIAALIAHLERIQSCAANGQSVPQSDLLDAAPSRGVTGGSEEPAAVEPRDDEQLGRSPIVPPERRAVASSEHYELVASKLGSLVIFLGAGANTDEHEGEWQQGRTLPNDRELAEYLASQAGLSDGKNLAEVAQHARVMHGERDVFAWLRDVLHVPPTLRPVHEKLARFPARMEELGMGKRYQMIVTPKYDAALEAAFREADEPFDVAIYVRPQPYETTGQFVHLSWEDPEPKPIAVANDYRGFPFEADTGRLKRTVIVRINGAIDYEHEEKRWPNNYVITEDHYIDYLRSGSAEQIVPGQILEKLRTACYLFLGYTIADWRMRMFLHSIFQGPHLGTEVYWAVTPNPSMLEKRLWSEYKLSELLTGRTKDYLDGLEGFLGA